jgi:hypothetical protein
MIRYILKWRTKKMKPKAIFVGLLLSIIFVLCTYAQQDDFPVLKGSYLGQKPPGTTPEIFAPGIVSTNMNEDGGPIFTPDGKEIFWRIGMSPFSVFVYMKQDNGFWSQPDIAPFSGKYSDAGLSISPDGKKIFFASKRPFTGIEGMSKFHTWVTEKMNGSWQTPVPVGQPIDHPDEYYTRVSVAANGTLIKQSEIPGGKGARIFMNVNLLMGNIRNQ